jgi:hypothetical protein
MRTALLAPIGVLLAAATQTPAPKYMPPPPVQPLPFSHRQHVAAGLQCKNCHEIPEPGDFAGLPATSKCMSCHIEIKKESDAIQRLAGFHKDGKPVPWARVYRIADYVFFSHKEHLARAGATCDTCHGPIQERDVLRKEKETSMAACMDCHRAKNASLACDYCHEQR